MKFIKLFFKELLDIRYWFQDCKYYNAETGCTKKDKCKRKEKYGKR